MKKLGKKIIIATVLLSGAALSAAPLAGATSSSTSYIVPDQEIQGTGGYGTSTSFGLWGSFPFIAAAPGTSTSFGLQSGFQSYNVVVLQVLSADNGATPGVAQAVLSWTAPLGIAHPTYQLGQSFYSGGPYTYDPLQSNRTATHGSLSFGSRYYFIVRVYDGINELIGYSNEASIVPYSTGSGGGGGGGAGSGFIPGNTSSTPGTLVYNPYNNYFYSSEVLTNAPSETNAPGEGSLSAPSPSSAPGSGSIIPPLPGVNNWPGASIFKPSASHAATSSGSKASVPRPWSVGHIMTSIFFIGALVFLLIRFLF